METNSTSVLVVGGSLVGLSAAVFLSWRGVPTIVVERHSTSSLHPRAIGFTPRTLELYRAVGLGSQIPQAPANFHLGRVKVESLAGKWFEETSWTPKTSKTPVIEYSPCNGAAIAQDRLEPILRNKAIELGADVRLSTELVSFQQNNDNVVVNLRQRDGKEYTLQAKYVIAADGNRSQIRESLGIGRSGRGHIRTLRSVLFRAPLEEYLKKGPSQFSISQPDFEAFLTTYADGRWILMFSDDEERDENILKKAIIKAIGRSDLEIEIITTGRWEMCGLIADSFSSGRIFIAGDAAHTLPPNRGGFGANTGIEDVHNLVWKLSAVLSGESTSNLLDTYDAERRPIAWLRHQQIFARGDYKASGMGVADNVTIIDDQAMEFGQLYRSTIILGADDTLAPALCPDQWAGQPGTRSPHHWVNVNGEHMSILDLFQRNWILLAENEQWSMAAAHASKVLGIKLQCLLNGVDFQLSNSETFQTAFGLEANSASLIRPDGYIAWRSVNLPADSIRTLTEAFSRVSCAKNTNL